MKTTINLIAFLLITIFVTTSCGSDDIDDLYGTWTTTVVPINFQNTIYYYDGLVTHVYNEDGTYSASIDFVVPSDGCNHLISYTGTFTDNETTLTVTPTGGARETISCADPAQNLTSTDHAAALLTSAATDVTYEVDGNTLVLTHSDGAQRIFRRS